MMRLTQRLCNKVFFSEDACFMCAYSENYHGKFCENIGCESSKDRTCPYLRVIDRLADYEDTGFEPQEIASLQKWIPVTERLPEKDGFYLIVACDEGCPYGEGIWYDTVVVTAEYYDDGRWVWYENGTEYDLCDIVTHWMPLPQPPKEG